MLLRLYKKNFREFDRRFVIKQQPLTAKIRKLGAKGRVIVPDIRGLMVTNRLNANKDVVFSEYQDFGPATQYSMSYQKPVTASFRVINKKSKVFMILSMPAVRIGRQLGQPESKNTKNFGFYLF